ncbi:MAG TPA: hypothetical protein VIG99_15310 [Myxococcaceae bacterium]
MKPAGLRRAILAWIARWLQAWTEEILRQEGPATATAAEPGASPPTVEGGPPAHWVERVRQGAPELLMGLGASPRNHAAQPAWPAPVAGEAPGGPRWSEGVRHGVEPEAPPARGGRPSPRMEAPPPRPIRPMPVAQAQAHWTEPPPRPGEPPRPVPARPPHSSRADRAPFIHNRVVPRRAAAPPSMPEPRDPPRAAPAPWPRLETAAGSPLPETVPWPVSPETAASPWPELPLEEPGEELEDGLLRRLERLHRLAREQRGD